VGNGASLSRSRGQNRVGAVAHAVSPCHAILPTLRVSLKQPFRLWIEHGARKALIRAEFAMQVRRLEMTIADMQAKTAGSSGEVARKAAEIDHLRSELRRSQVAVLRFQARELMRRSTVRMVMKLVVYLFERSRRPKLRRPGQAHAAGARHFATPSLRA
jgi:hypothetical protein